MSLMICNFLQVCKKIFLRTFDISQQMVDNGKAAFDEDGFRVIRPDHRGGSNRTPDPVVLAITRHIESFPTVSFCYLC